MLFKTVSVYILYVLVARDATSEGVPGSKEVWELLVSSWRRKGWG